MQADVVYRTSFWSEVGQWITTIGFWVSVNVLARMMLAYILSRCGFEFEGFGLWDRMRRGWNRLRQ